MIYAAAFVILAALLFLAARSSALVLYVIQLRRGQQ